MIGVLAEQYENIDPEFSIKCKKHFYGDDLMMGVNNIQEDEVLYFLIRNFN